MDVGGSTIASLQAKIGADPAQAKRDLGQINDAFEGTEKAAEKAATKAEGFGSRMSKALGGALQFATGGLILKGIETVAGGITDFFAGGIDESKGWNAAMAQTEAVVKSTGGAAGLSAQQLGDLASSLSGANGMSMASDDAVLAGENMLATFTNIGKTVFPQATATALDMAAAFGGDAKSQSLALGKALNDPIAGVGALSRVGVTFTAQQKEQIKAMVAVGDTAGAQRVILAELNKEVGGSAKAAADADGGAFRLSEQFANLKQTVGDALLPILQQTMGFLSSDAVMGTLQGVADLVAQGLTAGFAGLKTIFEAIAPTAQAFVNVLTQAFGGGLKLDAIQALPGFLQPVATLLGTLSENVGEFFGALQSGTDPLTAIGDLIQNNLVDLLGMFGIKQADAVGFVEGFKTALGNVAAFIQDPLLPVLGNIGGWLLEQIPKAVQFASDAWNNVLQPALAAAWQYVQDNVLPMLGDLAVWLQENVPKALQQTSDYWNNTLQPALKDAWAYFNDNIIPILKDVWTWLSTNVPAAIQTVSDFWNNTLQPALKSAWDYFNTNILPILKSAADWLGTNVPKAIQTVSDFWNNTLLPALKTNWAFFNDNILPILKSVASTITDVVGTAIKALTDIWNNNLLPAIKGVWDFFTKSILPLFQAISDVLTKVTNIALTALAGIFENVILPAITKVWDYISKFLKPIFDDLGGPVSKGVTGGLTSISDVWEKTLKPAFNAVWSFISNSLAPAFNTLKDAIGKVTGFLQDLSNNLDNIKLPDWMTPGSPTPWEIGLRGVGDALALLTGQGLPGLGGAIADVMTQGGADGPLGPLVGAFQALPGTIAGLTPQITSTMDTLLQSLASSLTGSAGAGPPTQPGKKKGLLGGITAMAAGALSTFGIKNPDSPGPKAPAAAGPAGDGGLGQQMTAALTDVFKGLVALVDYHLDKGNADGLLQRWILLLGKMGTRIDQGAESLKAYSSAAMKGVLDLMLMQVDENFPAITGAWAGYLNGLKALVDDWVSSVNAAFAGISYPQPPGGTSTPPGQTPPATPPAGEPPPPPGANLPPGIKGNAAIFGGPALAGAGGGAVYNITINGMTVQAPAAVGEWLVAVAQHKQTRGRGLELKK